MRILIGSTSYHPNISGVAIFARELGQFLASRNHDVAVVTAARGFDNSIEKDGLVRIYRLKALPNPFRPDFFVPIFYRGFIGKIFNEFKPEIVHIQDPTPFNQYIAKLSRRQNIPIVTTHHFVTEFILDYLPYFIRLRVKSYLEKKIVEFYNRYSTRVTSPSQNLADILTKMGVKKPIHVLSNGVDTDFFSRKIDSPAIRQKYRLPKKPIVLYVGRLDPAKSVEVLLRAAPKVLSKVDAHFVLVGGGKLIEKYTKFVKLLGLENRVTFTGPIAHQSGDLVSLYQSADVFVIPSTTETQSIATMEAMAAGKPIVAARAGALPELVKHGVNGFLFTPGDNLAGAENIAKILQNPPLGQAMGQESKALVAVHNLDDCLKKFETLYRSAT